MVKNLAIIIALLVGLYFGVNILGQKTNLFSKASSEASPESVKITNISDSSFTVSWTTDKIISGFIRYGTEEDKLLEVAGDLRDTHQLGSHQTHYVVVKGLKPDTNHYFKIISDGKESSIYSQMTTPILDSPPPIGLLAFGSIRDLSGNAPGESIVYLTPKDGTMISTLSLTGDFALNVDNVRSLDLKGYSSLKEGDLVEIIVEDGQELVKGEYPINSQKPLPTITLNHLSEANKIISPEVKVDSSKSNSFLEKIKRFLSL